MPTLAYLTGWLAACLLAKQARALSPPPSSFASSVVAHLGSEAIHKVSLCVLLVVCVFNYASRPILPKNGAAALVSVQKAFRMKRDRDG